MASILCGKKAVQANQQMQAVVWKTTVVKPFPTQFVQNKQAISTMIRSSKEEAEKEKTGITRSHSSPLLSSGPISLTALTSSISNSLQMRTLCNQAYSSKLSRGMNVPILKPSEIDINAIDFSQIEYTNTGRKFVPLTYQGKVLRIVTPSLRAPFGFQRYPVPNGKDNYVLQLSFDGVETNEEIKSLLRFLKDLDAAVKNQAVKRASTWFEGKPVTPDQIYNEYRSSLKPPRDPKYAPLWKLKLQPVTVSSVGIAESEVFIGGERVMMDEILPQSHLTSIIELRGVWFLLNHFGITWTLLQTQIDSQGGSKNNLTGSDK